MSQIVSPTSFANEPLPPLTDNERNAFIAIFDRSAPQGPGGVIPGMFVFLAPPLLIYVPDISYQLLGTQAVQILSRSQLPTSVLAQIWDLADAECAGSLSRGKFVVAMYFVKLVMNRRQMNPG